MKNTTIQNIDVIATKIEYIARDVADIKETLESGYVTKGEFEPIKKVVYGMVTTILVGVLGSILALILRQ